MFSAILILLLLPITDVSRSRGMQFRPLSKIAFYIFIANFLILMQLGAKLPAARWDRTIEATDHGKHIFEWLQAAKRASPYWKDSRRNRGDGGKKGSWRGGRGLYGLSGG